ncbi:MAG TPA: S8 family serine peptidase [Gaiellaceae bacterium]|nr:S8 family serine peptidase [Gaiellaceae bacterium]
MRNTSGKRGETRSSALWGTGNRGGETRSNALWGKGGRGAVTALVAALAVSVPLASSAIGNKSHVHAGGNFRNWLHQTYVSPVLSKHARNHPNSNLQVIVQADSTFVLNHQVKHVFRKAGIRHFRKLNLIHAVSVTIDANQLNALSKIKGLTVTPDAPVKVSGYSSNQLWPYEAGLARDWSGYGAPTSAQAPTIAVVDSGVQSDRSDFANGGVVGSVNLSTLDNTLPGAADGRGHGTFVAGIAAGRAPGYAGALPQSSVFSVKVMNSDGIARTSDVINACQWILANKAKYNIKVANFSLHSSSPASFLNDPLDKAVESLWFNGVVVVAAAGNYGVDGQPSGVLYAPGNDPFVITVGAVDLNGTWKLQDDFNAPWSAYGYTPDGFAKPDLAAAGRYMIGPVPSTSTLALQRPDNVVAPGYIQLSGTSFSAPVVAGAAAQILARHPSFTPDQVKGALMVSARKLQNAAPMSVGVGELRMDNSAFVQNPPNPNKGLDQFVKTDPTTGTTAFDAVSWFNNAKADVSWDDVSWNDVSWSDADFSAVSWADISWSDASWATVSWNDVSWNDVSWADVSWADVSHEDAAEGDADGGDGYALTPDEAASIMADPDIAPNPDTLPCDPTTQDCSSDGSDTGSSGGDSSP